MNNLYYEPEIKTYRPRKYNDSFNIIDNRLFYLKLYLKNKYESLTNIIIDCEKYLSVISKDDFYYDNYVRRIHELNAQKELIKEIEEMIE